MLGEPLAAEAALRYSRRPSVVQASRAHEDNEALLQMRWSDRSGAAWVSTSPWYLATRGAPTALAKGDLVGMRLCYR